MSLGHIVRIRPSDIRYSLMGAGDETAGIMSGDYDLARATFDRDVKHRSVRQRYVDGRRWEDTDLFTDIYRRRFEAHGMVRGTYSIDELAHQYYTRVDGMFDDLKHHGWRLEVGGRPVPLPNLHIGHDGEPLLGNNGNHRVAMAQIIGLDAINCRIQSIHKNARRGQSVTEVVSPTTDAIPAMTTLAERQTYYRLAREAAPKGAVIEMGAWLGASTVYIASGIRDSGVTRKVDVYDRWRWDDSHARKVTNWKADHPDGGYVDAPMPNAATMFETFETNLGEVRKYVRPHIGEIKDAKWNGDRIALAVFDAPKRVKDIARALQTFGPYFMAGTRMAWQDFAHFPSYEIVAALHRLKDFLTFDYGVAPGTTTVFTVKEPWPKEAVSADALGLSGWTAEEVIKVWSEWTHRLPQHMRARFRCGAALFLCDIGKPDDGRNVLREILKDSAPEVMPKWNYLKQHRYNLKSRYEQLFAELPR